MPGFSFSPSILNHTVILHTKTGHTITGEVIEVNPAEIVVKHPEYPDRLVRINRDEVIGYTGFDDKKRKPKPIELYLNRCFNPITRCNGIKRLDSRPLSQVVLAKDCPAFNKECQIMNCDFYKLRKDSKMRLLDGMIIGDYPKKTAKDDDDE